MSWLQIKERLSSWQISALPLPLTDPRIMDAAQRFTCHQVGFYAREREADSLRWTWPIPPLSLSFAPFLSTRRQQLTLSFFFPPGLECLDHSTRRPFYYCAPNDVWSLGVILVNLTCGRNPWKQASFEDSTYRAFTRQPGFLKTILPVSDELNDILGRIFTRNPDHRITLPELRARIIACSGFTQQAAAAPLPTPPASPEPMPSYVDCEESIVDEEFSYGAPLSPASSNSDSASEGSTCLSDDGSLTSSCSTIDDLEDDDGDMIEEPPEIHTPPPQHPEGRTSIYDPGDTGVLAYPQQQDFGHQMPVPVQEHIQPMHMPVPQSCLPKLNIPLWDLFNRCAQQPPLQHHAPFAFHQQVPLFTPIHGC